MGGRLFKKVRLLATGRLLRFLDKSIRLRKSSLMNNNANGNANNYNDTGSHSHGSIQVTVFNINYFQMS